MRALHLLLPLLLASAPSGAPLAPATERAVFAGGCFWGVDAVFRHTRGVVSVVSGYAGGHVPNPGYERVSSGTTGHAESVAVTFDPAQISYEQLLAIFFTVAHDPTERDRQGPDVGPQYRSAVFYTSAAQRQAALAYIARLTRDHVYPAPIVTEVTALDRFYPAEAYHQDYLAHHRDQPYIVYNDLPKLARLEQRFPRLYRP